MRGLASLYIESPFAQQDQSQIYTLEDSRKQGLPGISVNPEEGRFVRLWVHASRGNIAPEIGTPVAVCMA